MIESYSQKVLEEYTQGKYFGEVQRAREEFFSKTGQINEDDKSFESRMTLFLDWYIFDRKLEREPLTPIKTYYRTNKNKFSKEDLKVYRGMANHIHSIFTINNSKGGFVQVEDIATKKIYAVNPGTMKLSISVGDMFEGRIIPVEKEWWFANGFCFHPQEAKKFILREIQKAKLGEQKDYKELIFNLSAMRLKLERYHHIEPEKIYLRNS